MVRLFRTNAEAFVVRYMPRFGLLSEDAAVSSRTMSFEHPASGGGILRGSRKLLWIPPQRCEPQMDPIEDVTAGFPGDGCDGANELWPERSGRQGSARGRWDSGRGVQDASRRTTELRTRTTTARVGPATTNALEW